jgi:hypothetical protein
MADPVITPTALVGPATKVVELTVKAVSTKIADAKARKDEDVERVLDYLDAARESIAGLEQESQRLLTQASVANLYDKRDVKALRSDLDAMLFEDRIRPLLIIALEGARQSTEGVRERATKRLQLKRGDKMIAAREADGLLNDLTEYQEALSVDLSEAANQLSHLGTPTGPRVHYLASLRQVIAQLGDGHMSPGEGRKRADEVIAEARNDPNYFAWLDLIRRVEQVSHRVRSTLS